MSFLEDLMEHMTKRIEYPAEASSTEVFTIRCSPEDMDRILKEWKIVPIEPLPIELPEE